MERQSELFVLNTQLKMKKRTIIIIIAIFLVASAILLNKVIFVIAESSNPEDERQIGYEFLDEGKVVHIWNTQDDYFFDKNSGIQLTNHFQDYWSRNIFCVGYYSGKEWIKIKCADELSNFERGITSGDDYVNATLWKDFIYGAYNFRLGVNYYLGLNDRNLSITIYGKNIGDDIPFNLGFAWKVTDVDISSNNIDDKILINNTIYLLNGTYDLIFKDMNKAYFKIQSSSQYLQIDWNKNLNYAVKMYGDGNQEDFYVMLLVNAGIFNSGIEKSTVFYWIDSSQCTGNPNPCGVHGTQYNCQRCGCGWTKEIARKINIGDAWKDVTEMKINILGDVCTGFATPCEHYREEYECMTCGCEWVYFDPFWECAGTPDLCSSHGASEMCTGCGCDWEESVKTWKTVTNVYINIGDAWKTVADSESCGGDAGLCSSHGEEDCKYCGCFWLGEPPP